MVSISTKTSNPGQEVPRPNYQPIEKPCTSCGHPIMDRYALHVTPDSLWHVTCLCCVKCGKSLDEKLTCYILGGKTYCREDYLRYLGGGVLWCLRGGGVEVFGGRGGVLRY